MMNENLLNDCLCSLLMVCMSNDPPNTWVMSMNVLALIDESVDLWKNRCDPVDEKTNDRFVSQCFVEQKPQGLKSV